MRIFLSALVLVFAVGLSSHGQSTSSVDEQGYLLRNGQRFFPIGSYSITFRAPFEERREALLRVGEAGFNLAYLSTINQYRYNDLLDLADSLGVSIIGGFTKWEGPALEEEIRQTAQRYRDYPALLGWQLLDDGDDAWNLERDGKIKAGVNDTLWTTEEIRRRERSVKRADPNHVTYQTLTGYYPSRRAAAERYVPLSDVSAVQIYPIESLPDYDVTDANALTQTYYRTLRYVQVAEANRRPMFLNLQTFKWDDRSPNARYPTPRELRNMSYSGLAAGIKGILSYDFSLDLYENQRPLWNEFVAIKDDILAHDAFYLNGALTRYDTGDATLVASYYEHQDQLLLIVVNTHYDQAKEVTIMLPDDYASATPLAERMPATLMLNKNEVTGKVAPQAVQAYVLTRQADPPVTDELADGIYELHPASALDKVVEVAEAVGNGDNVQQGHDRNAAYQRWQITAVGEGYYRLSPTHDAILGLDVRRWGTDNRTNVQVWRYNRAGQANQQWKITLADRAKGHYLLTPRHAEAQGLNRRLDVASASPAAGTNLHLYRGNRTLAQRFVLERVSESSARLDASQPTNPEAKGEVYPNPSRQGSFTVRGADGPIRLYDAQGRLVPTTVRSVGTKQTQITMKHHRPGVYVLRVPQQDGATQHKVVVE